jgi:hypothetical protein
MSENVDNPFGKIASTLNTQIQDAHSLQPVQSASLQGPVQAPGFMPPEEKNPFNDIAGDLAQRTKEDEEQRKKFIATRASHSEWTQEQAQQALLLSAAHPDVDPSVIAQHLEDFQASTTQEQLANSLRNHPRLAKWMDDPLRATAIKDDVSNLGWLEWLISGKMEHVESYQPTPGEIAYAKANGLDPKWRQTVPNIWQSALSNAWDQQKAVKLSLADMRGLLTPEEKTELTALRRKGTNRDFAGEDSSLPWMRRIIADTVGMVPYLGGSVAARTIGGFTGAGAGGLMTAELGPAAAAGAATGGAIGEHIGAQAWDFYQQVGPLYEDLLDLKHPDGSALLTPDEARNYALWTTLGTSTITSTFGTVVARALPGVRGLLTDVTKRGMSQALAEETGGKLLGRALLNYGKTLSSMGVMMGAQSGATAAAEEIAKSKHGETGTWARVIDASKEGFIKGAESAVLIGAWEPGKMLLHDSARYMQMQMDIMKLKALTDAAQNSSILKSSPQVGEKVLSHLTSSPDAEIKEFYIDPQGFDDIFNSKDLSARQAWEQLFGETRTYDQAKIDGAPMAVPADKFIAKLATLKNAKDFFQITKISPKGITLHEANNAESAQQARIKEIDEEITKTGVNPYKSIEEDFYKTAIDAGIPEKVAKDEAKVTAQRVKGWVAYYPKDMPENDPYLWYTRIFSNLEMKTEKGEKTSVKPGLTKEFQQASKLSNRDLWEASAKAGENLYGKSQTGYVGEDFEQTGFVHTSMEELKKQVAEDEGSNSTGDFTHGFYPSRPGEGFDASDNTFFKEGDEGVDTNTPNLPPEWIDPVTKKIHLHIGEDQSIYSIVPTLDMLKKAQKLWGAKEQKSFEQRANIKLSPDVWKKFNDLQDEQDQLLNAKRIQKMSLEDFKKIMELGSQIRDMADKHGITEFYQKDRLLRGQLFTRDGNPGEPIEGLVKLYKAADPTTFSHEMMHFWFETMASFATEPGAPAEMQKDFKTLLSYAGYKDYADRMANMKAPAEERIAYAWEKYLSEGKAPVPELRSVFRHMKFWMLKIYGQIGPGSHYEQIYGQPLEMSDEVRRVFDRLHGAHTATEEAAKQAGVTTLEKLIQYMSPQEQTFYRQSVENLKEQSEQELIQHMRQDELRETKEWFRDAYKEQRDEVQKALAKRPEYRALSILQDGSMPGGRKPIEAFRGLKLDPDSVRDVLGSDDLSAYPRGIWAKGGKSPDEIAYLFGFDGGDALLAGLRKTAKDGSFAKAVGLRAKARMTARYGAALLEDPQKLGDIAVETLNNMQQVRKIMLEMRALRKGLNPDAPPLQESVSPEQLQMTAEHILSTKALKDLDGSRYVTAQRAASVRAMEAVAKGDLNKAYAEKEYELLSGFLYKAAQKFKTEAEKVEGVMTRASTDGVRKRLGLADPQIRNISDAVLESTGIRDFQRGESANAAALSGWEGYAKQNSLELPYDEQTLRDAIINAKQLRLMTLPEAKDVANALTSIQHYGKTLHEIMVTEKRVALNTAIQEITTEMVKSLPFLGKEPAAKTQVGAWEVVTRRLQSFDGAALEPETLFGWMGKSAQKYIWDRYIESRNTHDELAQKVTDWFHEQWSKLPKELQEARYRVISDFDKVLPIRDDINLAGARDHTTLWMLALNMGNESNKQRMLDGFGWTESQVMNMLNKHMSKSEWDWVQSVWHLADKELWPKIAAKAERTTGVAPDKIKASRIVTPHGAYEGGYFPARYEPRASALGAMQTGDVQRTNTTIGRMGTIKTYTKDRAANYSDIVSLQWSEVPNHISQVIYDLAFDEYTRDMNKLLSNQTMQDTMYQRLGSQRSLQVNDWRGIVAQGAPNGVARGVRELANGVLGGLRSRAVLSSIGWSLTVAAGDTSHPLAVMAAGIVKPQYGAPVLAEMMFRYGSMRDTAMTMSKEVAHRADSVTFQLRQELSQVGDRGPQGPISKAYHAVRDTAFFFVQHLDNAVTTWVWNASYRQALGQGLDSAAAVKQADGIIRQTMPTHTIAEQSALLREKQTVGSLFMFYGYFNKLYNVARVISHNPAMAWIDAETPGQYASAAGKSAVAAGRVMGMLMMSIVGGELLSGRGKEDDETWGQWAARKTISAPFSLVPLVGTVADQAAGVLITGKRKEISLRQAPALAWADDMFKSLGKIASPKVQDDEKAWEMLRIILSTVGLPGSRQLTRTGLYLTSGEAGRDANANRYGSVSSGLVYGERKKKQPATIPTMIENLANGRTP